MERSWIWPSEIQCCNVVSPVGSHACLNFAAIKHLGMALFSSLPNFFSYLCMSKEAIYHRNQCNDLSLKP